MRIGKIKSSDLFLHYCRSGDSAFADEGSKVEGSAARLNSARPLALSRRGVLAGLGAVCSAVSTKPLLAASPLPPSLPQAATKPAYRLETGCSVSAARLDNEVANAYSKFNAANVVPNFSVEKHGARNDVTLHRIATRMTVPETGEDLEVTGLLALPQGVQGDVPLVSWQHGTILSSDQVPSNLIKLANPDYMLDDNLDSLESLLNIQRFAANGFAVVAADYVGKGRAAQWSWRRLCGQGCNRPNLYGHP